MKARSSIILGILLGGCAIALLVIRSNREKEGTEGANEAAHSRAEATTQHEAAGLGDGKARSREAGFESIEEAEQALLDYDMKSIFGSDLEECRRGVYRLRSLVAKMPEGHYSELAARFGEGADNNLQRHFLQMAIYQEWGRMNLELALADLSKIEDERRHAKALHSVFVGATDLDAEAAMSRAQTLDIETPGEFGDFERTDLMDSIFDTWIESDPFAALQWAGQAPVPEKRRDQWIADGLRAWTEKDPEAAQRWREPQ